MAMDSKGILWVAIWGGFAVNGFDSLTGKLIHQIELPVPHVSTVAFVGPELNELLITTSRKGLSKAELQKYPLSGKLFLITMENPGVSINPFIMNF